MLYQIILILALTTVALAKIENLGIGPYEEEEWMKEENIEISRNRRSTNEEEKIVGLTQKQHEESLKVHNMYRRMVNASNMEKLRYNMVLAEMAHNLTEKCTMDHWFPKSWPNQPFPSNLLGQNLFATTYYKLNVTFGITGWYIENKHYDYETNTGSGGQTGHYTQLVWADTTLVGCGASFCPNFTRPDGSIGHNFHYYGCNYGIAGNFVGVRPYKVGDACTKCRTGTFWCDTTEPRGLCESQYNGTSSVPAGVVCKGGSSCKNGAITCKCDCQCDDKHMGLFCDQSCADTDDLCGKSYGYPPYYCNNQYKNIMRRTCPTTCGICGDPSPKPCDFKTSPENMVTKDWSTTAEDNSPSMMVDGSSVRSTDTEGIASSDTTREFDLTGFLRRLAKRRHYSRSSEKAENIIL